MSITAAQVKELRERTGAGMMECKNALQETQGDIQAAQDLLRIKGQVKADKKSDRVTAEGCVVIEVGSHAAVMVELNCETDFVAREAAFNQFSQTLAKLALSHQIDSVDALMSLPYEGTDKTVDEVRRELIQKIGENIQVRRVLYKKTQGGMGSYIHNGRIGVLVEMETAGAEELAKDIAMHIAAFRPEAVRPEDVPAELVEKEKSIFRAQALESGKPVEIIEKMITGRISKFLNETSLYGQPFAKDQDKTVAEILKNHKATVVSFDRFEVGEGIEKKVTNFAEEVRAQVQGS